MAKFELVMPKMGESIMEATILNWVKNVGDKVEEDETILEIATDKVDSEIPSPVDGVISEILYKVDDVVEIGKIIAIIQTEAAEEGETPVEQRTDSSSVEIPEPVTKPTPTRVAAPSSSIMASTVSATNGNTNGTRFYSPLVKSIAKKENIAITELEAIPGSGKDGRLTKNDLLSYIDNKDFSGAKTAQPAVEKKSSQVSKNKTQSSGSAPVSLNGGDELIEMGRMRKLIADHMVNSKQTSPHVTSFVEADMTNIVNWRNANKEAYLKKYGEKITFTPIIMEAVVKSIKDFPMVNVSVVGDKIHVKKDINLGMATALPSGNLIVPVIKDAAHLNLSGLTKKVNDLARRARENKLKPEEIQGGTYTLTNVGTFGNVMGTPIINQPQVAILAAGAIRKKPAVVETEYGDLIAVRHMMFLSHSYDHRVVDGFLGGSFVRRVADYLEDFDVGRGI